MYSVNTVGGKEGNHMNSSQRMSFSMKALLFCGDKLLILQKKDRQGLKPWELPGGGVEFGEDPQAALAREIREETGLTMEFISPLATWRYRKGPHEYLTGLICLCTTNESAVILSHEHLDYRWIHPQEMSCFALHPSLLEGLKKINLSKLQLALQTLTPFCEGFRCQDSR